MAEASGTAIMTTTGGISAACLAPAGDRPERQRRRRSLSIAHKVCSPKGRSP